MLHLLVYSTYDAKKACSLSWYDPTSLMHPLFCAILLAG